MSKLRLLALALFVVVFGVAGALSAAAQTPSPGATGTTQLLTPGATGAVASATPGTAVAGQAATPSAVGPVFVTTMQGCAATPPVSTSAQGAAMFELSPDGNTMAYAITVFDINDVTEAHIHMGAFGQDGPVVVWLFPSPSIRAPQTVSGTSNGLLVGGTFTAADLVGPLAGMSMSDLVAQMRANNTFANVHTTANPNGEIRGQIVPTTLNPCAAPTAVGAAAATPSGTPRVTGSPTVSGTPRATGSPTVSGTPRVTGSPTVSGTPRATGSPTVSGTPRATGSPTARTATPGTTSSPSGGAAATTAPTTGAATMMPTSMP